MWKLLLALVLCVPPVANADLLFLKYEGAVSSIDELCPCPIHYSIGDPVSGVLTIDTALAPSDRDPRPEVGSYPASAVHPDFVFGASHPPGGMPVDRVTVFNNDFTLASPNIEGFADGFSATDAFADMLEPPRGPLFISPGTLDSLSIAVGRDVAYGQLFHDTGIVQSFDLKSAEGTTMNGSIWHSFGAAVGSFRQEIGLKLSHVSLGVCRP